VLREFLGAGEPNAGRGLYPRVSGYVTVVVKLHGNPHFVVWLVGRECVFDNRILVSI
jgi:hypothetical protein